MFRLIAIFILLMSLINPAYAGNKLQQNYEKNTINEIFKTCDYKYYSKIDKIYLIEDDYKYYEHGQSSLIGDMLVYYELLKKEFSTNESDVYYIDLLIQNLKYIVKNEGKLLTNPIIIEDKKYTTISEKIKEQIALYNISYSDQTSRKEKFLNAFSTDYAQKIETIGEKAFFTSLINIDKVEVSLKNKTYSIEQLLQERNQNSEEIEKLYAYYKSNSNDMKNNKQLVEKLTNANSLSKTIKTIIENDIYDECYQKYLHIYKNLKSRENIPEYDISGQRILEKKLTKESYISKISQLEKDFLISKLYQNTLSNINNYKSLNDEVCNYSYNYEKNQYYNWAKQNSKKIIQGSLEQFVYQNIKEPSVNSIYVHNPKNNLFLIVQQSVPGGVILTGKNFVGNNIYSKGSIFLQTNKKFADGAIISEPIIAEYVGFYDYTTVLGAKKRIYKFYRYGNNEIKNNFYGEQKFYFYLPY